ncbi:MAG TPA: hypothetical protein VMX17_07875 [Candidatus Glassbacteria bacterium]|nr:hypothetical protein [Candidatus Glassbacteria bacterium]
MTTNNDITMKKFTFHKHIDNGGVTFSLVDEGVEEGIVLHIETQYFGYPTLASRIRIDTLGEDWLQELGVMFIEASINMKKIDWEKRYNKQ